mmetsp:Transcript_60934/g.176293  ORF Transcript_60934/g.176293 Transcript_60934/m.176293 type:complete len:277 (+) Transcript_60934:2023-2853(+)
MERLLGHIQRGGGKVFPRRFGLVGLFCLHECVAFHLTSSPSRNNSHRCLVACGLLDVHMGLPLGGAPCIACVGDHEHLCMVCGCCNLGGRTHRSSRLLRFHGRGCVAVDALGARLCYRQHCPELRHGSGGLPGHAAGPQLACQACALQRGSVLDRGRHVLRLRLGGRDALRDHFVAEGKRLDLRPPCHLSEHDDGAVGRALVARRPAGGRHSMPPDIGCGDRRPQQSPGRLEGRHRRRHPAACRRELAPSSRGVVGVAAAVAAAVAASRAMVAHKR